MNYIDLLLVLVVLFSAWGGWQKGFIVGILDLIGLAGSVLAAFYLYPYLAEFAEEHIPSLGTWTMPVCFLIILIIARIIIGYLLSLLVRDVPADTHRSQLNKLLGILPGMVNGIINATIVAALLLALPLSEGLSEKTRESRFASRLSVPAEWLESKISPVFDEAVRKSMNKMTVEPGSEKSVKLPFTVNDPQIRADLEARMLEMLNEERVKQGLDPLQSDPEMAVVARNHSRDMFARGYFSHVTPNGKDPFDRMKEGGVKYSTAGENLALGQTLSIAHNGLMNSPGHRANILRPQFGRVGIGVLDGGMHGLMITQKFRN